MTLSVKVRFEVFKRDRFTCQYCGKHPPDVLLEADHIVPRAAGGSDDIENLTTACTDCNRGKGARMLEEGTAPAINRSAIAEMRERVEQAKAYMEVLGGLEAVAEQQVWKVTEAWAKAFKAELIELEDGRVRYRLPNGEWPEERSVKRFIKKLGLEAVLDAVDVAASRVWYDSSKAVRYFYGVCHNAIRDGREPLSQQSTPECDGACGYLNGRESGVWIENQRIRELFLNHDGNGFETYADVVAALWPDD